MKGGHRHPPAGAANSAPLSPTSKNTAKYTNKDGSKFITVPKASTPAGSSQASPTTTPAPTTPAGATSNEPSQPVNRKKQKRRAKAAAKAAAEQALANLQRANGLPSPPPSHEQHSADAEADSSHDDAEDDNREPGPASSGQNGSHTQGAPPKGKKSKKKKKRAAGSSVNGSHDGGQHHAQPGHAPSSPDNRPSGMSREKIWNTTSQDERERIKEFWLGLSEDERKSLVKVEKDAVLRKMKEQQKHTCSCTVCGRKRNAIEEELEGLYDAYYEELEQYANHPNQGDGPPMLRPHQSFGPAGHSRPHGLAYSNHQPSHGRIVEHVGEDEEDDEDDGYEDEDEDELEDDDYSEDEPSDDIHRPDYPPEFFSFGNSLTVQGGILTVADDLLKNDGKKFIEMMEQLAERRMAREENVKAEFERGGHGHVNGESYDHQHYVQEEEEEYEDEDDYEEEDDEYEDSGDEEENMTEEDRMEEGRRMFQIFAARMFEQRVLTAYREKVAKERQAKLLEELEDENRKNLEAKARKAEKERKKKEKALEKKKLQAEEKARRDAEKAAEEKARKDAEARKAEEQRAKAREKQKEKKAKEEEALKKAREEALKKAKEEEQRKEAERQRRIQEQQEARLKKDKAREQKEREAREAREQQERDKREKEAKAKATREKEKAKQAEKAAQKAAAAAAAAAALQVPVSLPKRPAQQQIPAAAAPAIPQPPSASLASPQIPVATPVLPKAPTPVRARQPSQQEGAAPASQLGPGPGQNPSPHTITPVHASPGPTAPPGRLGQPSTGSQSGVQMPPHPASPPPLGLYRGPSAGMPFPPGLPPQIPPGLGPPVHREPMFGQVPPHASMRAAPGFGHGFPPPPGFGGFGRGFPLQPPPGFPGPSDSPRSGMAQLFAGSLPNDPVLTHSRQGSGGFDPGTPGAAPLPISRPTPIARPSSVVHGRDSPRSGVTPSDPDVRLGSSALIGDDEPAGELIPPRRGMSVSNALPVPFPFYGGMEPLFHSPHNNPWAPSTSAPQSGFFPQSPTSRIQAWPSPMMPLSSTFNMQPGQHKEPRHVGIRKLLCGACGDLAAEANRPDEFFRLDIIRDIMASHSQESITEDDLLEICETEGDLNNGGGIFELREDASSGQKFIRWVQNYRNSEPRPIQRAVGAPGDIGSPLGGTGGGRPIGGGGNGALR